MPNPKSDADQLRFSQIRSRMMEGISKNCSSLFLDQTAASTREDLVELLIQSPMIVEIIECCAYEAQCIEEERSGKRRG